MNNPELYKKVNDVQRRDINQLFEEFGDLINWRNDGTESVLDIGCGSGDVTYNLIGSMMPKPFKCLKGVDKSLVMVQHANKHYKSSSVLFEQWDVTSAVDNKMIAQFDHVFSFYTLHWVKDQTCAFQNIYEVLKPNGDCLVTFLADHVFYNIFNSQMANPKFMEITKDAVNAISPYRNKTNAEAILKSLTENIGFVDVVVRIEAKQYSYFEKEEFKSFVKAIYPPATRITGDLQNEMLEEFCMKCLVGLPDSASEQVFITPYKLISFYGRKN